jgi:ABC-2 type transport system permease protein
MQYKVSFLLAMLGSFAANVIDFGAVVILLTHVPLLAGWALPEVALLYGMAAISFAMAEMLAAALDSFDVHIRAGTFDRVLTRPLGALAQVMTEDFALRRVGRVAQGVLVLGFAQQQLGVSWSGERLLVLVVALAAGAGIFFAIFVLSAAFCFWSVQGKEATHVVTYGGDFMAAYPLDMYRGWLRRFVTFVLPLAFVNYYPALYLLDRSDPLGLPGWCRLVSPLVAVLMGLVAWRSWLLGVRHYQSTGT